MGGVLLPASSGSHGEQACDHDPEYIDAAPAAGQPQLRRLYPLLKEVAPGATEAVKWGTPFFVEPRFVFGFSRTSRT